MASRQVDPIDPVTDGTSPAQPPTETLQTCATEIFGKKWTAPVLYCLATRGAMQFSDLKATLDVSSKVLSRTLTTLEEEYRVVDREVVDAQPIQVQYSLTERGAALEPLLAEMVRWGREHLLGGEPARR